MTYTGGAWNTTVTLAAATEGVILTENPLRRKVILCNVGAGTAFIALGATASANNGIYLSSGGSVVLEPDTYGYIYKGIIKGYSTAGCVIAIVEEPGFVR